MNPFFLGIGAMKSGTTWISEILRAHPDIFIAHGKELHFFSWGYDRNIDYYLKNFKHSHKYKIVGEFSVSYLMKSNVAAKRIYNFNPEVKLIVSLRDPVDRAFSEYRWRLKTGEAMPPFQKAIEQFPALIKNGLYYDGLKPFWELFSDDQIHFVLYDDIMNKPGEVQKNIYRFLEVNDEFESGLVKKVIGKTIVPRSLAAEKSRIKLHSLAMKYNMQFIITWIKKYGLSEIYRCVNDKGNQSSVLSKDVHRRIIPYFIEDLKKIQDRAGLDISSWLLV